MMKIRYFLLISGIILLNSCQPAQPIKRIARATVECVNSQCSVLVIGLYGATTVVAEGLSPIEAQNKAALLYKIFNSISFYGEK